MGNSKQARFSRIGATPHHANNAFHLHMTSAPASTTGRTFRTPFLSTSRGMFPSNQNNLRFSYQTVTPEIRRRLWEGGGKSSESMKPPLPEFEPWVKFSRTPISHFLNDLSLNDNKVKLWDMSKGTFEPWSQRVETHRVFVVTKGTPYDSSADIYDAAVDFCGNATDASFLLANQPFAVRLEFDPATFISDPEDFHFQGAVNKTYGIHYPRDPPVFDVSCSVLLGGGSRTFSGFSRDLSVNRPETSGQAVDISFQLDELTDAQVDLFRAGGFVLDPQITQRSKRSGTYEFNRASASTNFIEISNNLENGIFVYTPPYLIVDASLVHGDVHIRGQANQSKQPVQKSRRSRYPGLNYGVGSDISALIIADFNAVGQSGIHLTLNHPFPSDVSSDWIKSVQYSFDSDQSTFYHVKDISIGTSPNGRHDRLLFNINNSPAPIFSRKHFWLRTELTIPKTCKQRPGKNEPSIHFTMDLSSNMIYNEDQNITVSKIQLKRKGIYKLIYP